MTITSQLAGYYADMDYDSLPETIVKEAKLCLLDSLGCILAGAQTKEVIRMSQELQTTTSDEVAPCIGLNQKSSLLYASILNGSMAHAVEMDDVHKQAKSHAGAVVVPTILTYGTLLKSSGKQIITSLVAGYETMLRIGKGINATEHRVKGWHATSTCGAFGAAASAAKLANFDQKQMVHALGLAGTQSSGLWAFKVNGANSKMFHAGSATNNGILAVLLVKGGLTGAEQIIEAEDGGFFQSSSNDYSYEQVIENLENHFLIGEITRKPFACCRSMHPPIEAALNLKKKNIPIDDIDSIKVYTYKVAKMQCGLVNNPRNESDAKFSIPYGVAVSLVKGKALVEQFTSEKIKDEQVNMLAKKVEVIVDEHYDAQYPDNWGCSLEIRMSDKKYVETIENAKGDPDKPLTKKEVEDKFFYLSKDLIGEENCKKIIEMIDQLENLEDISQLVINLCSKKITPVH